MPTMDEINISALQRNNVGNSTNLSRCDNFATMPKRYVCATVVLQPDHADRTFQQARNGSAAFFSSFARRKDGKHREHQPFDGVSLLLGRESGLTKCQLLVFSSKLTSMSVCAGGAVTTGILGSTSVAGAAES